MKKLITLCIIVGSFVRANADSPLTSTPFYQAYKEVKMVATAAKSGGLLSAQHMQYLSNELNPIDQRLASINALGTNPEGLHNAELFFSHLQKKRGYEDIGQFLELGKADEFMCYGYLLAMDNYFDVHDATTFMFLAEEQMPKSYAVALISSLVYAQAAMESDWCSVYMIPNEKRMEPSYTRDLRPEAEKIIFDYLNPYEESCFDGEGEGDGDGWLSGECVICGEFSNQEGNQLMIQENTMEIPYVIYVDPTNFSCECEGAIELFIHPSDNQPEGRIENFENEDKSISLKVLEEFVSFEIKVLSKKTCCFVKPGIYTLEPGFEDRENLQNNDAEESEEND